MKHLYFLLSLVLLAACTSAPELDETPEDEHTVSDQKMSPEELIKRTVESTLSIPATENYSLDVYRAEVSGDDSLDYIVTVNRLEKAIDVAVKSGMLAKRAEVGYMGSYNYIFYMDGATKVMTREVPIPSSPHAELSVSFDNVRSEAHPDILVDFRIRNSCFRRFFTIVRGLPMMIFEVKLFDGLGTDDAEAFHLVYEPGSYSLAKDIVIYKAELEAMEVNDPLDVYSMNPTITPTDEIERRWFFNSNQLKYFTEK